METVKMNSGAAADLHSTKSDSGGSERGCRVPVLDGCLKKRCLDRYDSSESSDRLVENPFF